MLVLAGSSEDTEPEEDEEDEEDEPKAADAEEELDEEELDEEELDSRSWTLRASVSFLYSFSRAAMSLLSPSETPPHFCTWALRASICLYSCSGASMSLPCDLLSSET
jgi:hypothetical protein